MDEIERESMEFDVVIVGAGPAGLAAAIRLKQLQPDLTVVVLEKGGEVGAHILSGAVVDPIGIDRLLPGWRDEADHPFKTPVTDDRFLVLTGSGSLRLPNFMMPPLMNNHGNFVVSLGNVCKWLAGKAEALGVEIYPGFAAAGLLYDEAGAVKGVVTGDMGIERDGTPGPGYTPGMALLGKYVLIGEGARGSLAKELIAKYRLAEGREPGKYGIGLKELWQVKPEHHRPGLVQHSFGWPLDMKTGGGSFLYHLEDNQVAVGFVVHLNYRNPYLSPFEEFQRFKTHPAIRGTFEGGKRLSYGARAITEGGFQSVPKLTFPGGALVGCAAGFVNVPRIKGPTTPCCRACWRPSTQRRRSPRGVRRTSWPATRRHGEAPTSARTCTGSATPSRCGRASAPGRGSMLGGFDMWMNTLFSVSPFGTMKHGKADYASLDAASQHQPIVYPKADGVLTFDRLSSVFLSNTNHEENQPVHLKVRDMDLQKRSEHDVFAGPSSRYCPAGVYEWVEEGGEAKFVINAQNCVHCKTCDIKDPNQNITWVPPQGGEGPVYINM